VTEERKHAIPFAVTLLCARRIMEAVDSPEHKKMDARHWLGVFEKEAIERAAVLMVRIDVRWPRGST
jgi:hypothetical protein